MQIPAWADNPNLWIAVLAVFGVLVLARRIPVLRTLVSLASWLLLIGIAVMLIAERGSIDPSIGRIASALDLDRQRVDGGTTRIRLGPDGHFWARVRIGDVERRMLVDSGATVTALSVDTARAAGLDPRPSPFPLVIRTANGAIAADTATVPELRLGNVVARDLSVVVSPAFGETDVIGMNLLSRLRGWRVDEGTLILEPHHPQPGDTSRGG